MKIKNHRLWLDDQTEAAFRRSPNQSGAITPEYLIMHFTAGASAESSINWLLNPVARASAHLVVARDGEITQLVACNRKAWHAGRSRWDNRSGLNGFSIGIELDNHGGLSGAPGDWRTGWGRSVADEEVLVAAHKNGGEPRGWHRYPEIQLTTAAELAATLINHYGLKDVLGHEDIAPQRKVDPGPAFPTESFRSAAMGRYQDDEEIYATTTVLNIRSGPGTRHEKLPGSPLPQGTRLELISRREAWCKVDVLDTADGEMDVSGWVYGRYIERMT